jgi:hypothetical protein
MSTITQYGSIKMTGAHPAKVPDGAGDLFYEQDRIRDFAWLWDRIGMQALDLFCPDPFLVSGGQVTQGADVSHVDIAAAIGYCPFAVDLGNSGAVPPATASEDVSAVRVKSTAVTAIALAGGVQGKVTGSATLNGAATNYVKLRYAEADSLTRARMHAAGSWYFTKTPDWSILIDTVAPTAYEVVLATLVGDGASVLTITQYPGLVDSITATRTYPAFKASSTVILNSAGAVVVDISTGAARAGTMLTLIELHATGTMTITTGAGMTASLGRGSVRLVWDGATWCKVGGAAFREVFTSGTAATWKAPFTGTYDVLAVGGGGGGGGAKSTSASYSAAAGAAAAGSTARKFWKLQAGNVLTYTIGAGGAGGATTPTSGGTGGDTTVANGGNTLTCVGGTGGTHASATIAHAFPADNVIVQSAPQPTGYFDIIYGGRNGHAPMILPSPAGVMQAAGGDSAFFAHGCNYGERFTTANLPGNPAGAESYGCGGQSGAVGLAISAVTGGAGTSGIIIIEF